MKKIIIFAIIAVIISCSKESVEPTFITASDNSKVHTDVIYDSVLYKNAFTKNTQNWKIEGDAQNGSGVPTYNSIGGNPGGYISAIDDGLGVYWYFSASNDFLLNMHDKYGKFLKFDLKQTGSGSQSDQEDVIIEGNGLKIHFNTTQNPNSTWTRYSVPLKAGNWLKEDNTKPTAGEMTNVLKHITKLLIRGEYIIGNDQGGLDNAEIVNRIVK